MHVILWIPNGYCYAAEQLPRIRVLEGEGTVNAEQSVRWHPTTTQPPLFRMADICVHMVSHAEFRSSLALVRFVVLLHKGLICSDKQTDRETGHLAIQLLYNHILNSASINCNKPPLPLATRHPELSQFPEPPSPPATPLWYMNSNTTYALSRRSLGMLDITLDNFITSLGNWIITNCVEWQ